jgi:hypothetical protein
MNHFYKVLLVEAMSERTSLLSMEYIRAKDGKRTWLRNYHM